MLPKPYYFRDDDFLYPIQGHPEYWFYVGRSDSKQVLIGLIGNDLAVIGFDTEGKCLGFQEPLLSVRDYARSTGGQELQEQQLRSEIERQVRLYRDRMGLADEDIHVKRFRFPDVNVGVDDLPDDIQDYLLNTTAFNERDRADLEDTLEGWKEEDLFVFWWGQSFTMDTEGVVTSS
jgi:hypothetical protein